MGVSTNYSIIQPLDDADPDAILQAYMAHEEVACKHPSKTQFNAAYRIFVCQEFIAAGPSVPLQKELTITGPSVPPRSFNQEDAAQDPSQRPVTLEDVHQRLKDIRLQMSESKKSSGKKYKYRERYAIKTRTRIMKHEPPDILKQYTWKPWTSRPESPRETITSTSGHKPKVKAPKPPLPVERMIKKDLVLALQWEHPTRTLDIGTINANVSRALKVFPAPHQESYLPRIKTCLADITRLAARTKRTCQRAIGQYLERLSLQDIDEVDKIILGKLCPPFSAQDTVEESEGLQENQDLDESNDNSNYPLLFFMSLLNAIYSSKSPLSTGKTGPVVRMFMDRAKDFLPQQAQTAKYPGSSFLRSTAVQLTVEFRKHFKNGSFDLCKKIECLKKKGLLPPDAVDSIDPKKSPVENFITLNRTTGNRRCLVPMSSFGNKFITISELDLTKVFWQDEALKLQL
ncbi:hypothetical protein BGZ82_001431, partial [Podila clonocystis]